MNVQIFGMKWSLQYCKPWNFRSFFFHYLGGKSCNMYTFFLRTLWYDFGKITNFKLHKSRLITVTVKKMSAKNFSVYSTFFGKGYVPLLVLVSVSEWNTLCKCLFILLEWSMPGYPAIWLVSLTGNMRQYPMGYKGNGRGSENWFLYISGVKDKYAVIFMW